MTAVGHNSIAADQLRLLVERIETLEDEKKGIADDIKDVYGEAKATGFDTKVLRKIIAMRKLSRDALIEERALIDTYAAAIGLDLV